MSAPWSVELDERQTLTNGAGECGGIQLSDRALKDGVDSMKDAEEPMRVIVAEKKGRAIAVTELFFFFGT